MLDCIRIIILTDDDVLWVTCYLLNQNFIKATIKFWQQTWPWARHERVERPIRPLGSSMTHNTWHWNIRPGHGLLSKTSIVVTTCRIPSIGSYQRAVGLLAEYKVPTVCVQSDFVLIKNRIKIQTIGPHSYNKVPSFKLQMQLNGAGLGWIPNLSKQIVGQQLWWANNPFAFRLDDLIIQISWKVLHNSKRHRHDDSEELYKKCSQPLNDLKGGWE